MQQRMDGARRATASVERTAHSSIESGAHTGAYRPQLLPLRLRDDQTWSTWVQPAASRGACLLLQRVAAGVGAACGPIVISGPAGSGKSHLLNAIARDVGASGACLCGWSELRLELDQSQRDGSRRELRRWLLEPGVLLIDDVEPTADDGSLLDELLSWLVAAEQGGHTVVLASRTLEALLQRPEALWERLTAGTLVRPGVLTQDELLRVLSSVEGQELLPSSWVEELVAWVVATGGVANVGRWRRLLRRAVVAIEAQPDIPMELVLSQLRPLNSSPPELAPRDDLPAVTELPPASVSVLVAEAQTADEERLAWEIIWESRLATARLDPERGEFVRRLEVALRRLREGDLQRALMAFHEGT